MSQSSNDTFPTAIHVAAALAIAADLLPALRAHGRGARRQGAGLGRDRQDRPHPHPGRDAADARAGVLGLCRARSAPGSSASSWRCPGLYELAQGGTAVGTGLNAPAGFAEAVAAEIAAGHRPPVRHRAQQVRGARRRRTRCCSPTARSTRWPASLYKIANDIRLLGSGPRSGPRRAGAARERAGHLDHARQGQPDPVRGADPGLRPGVRQPHGGDLRRQPGPLRAQRLPPGRRLQRAAVDPPAGRCRRQLHRPPARRARAAARQHRAPGSSAR